MPRSASRAASGRRAGIITAAPAPASARVASSPMPEYPPVTTQNMPDRSMPARTSAAVLSWPKPEPMGCCGVVIHDKLLPALDTVPPGWLHGGGLFMSV